MGMFDLKLPKLRYYYDVPDYSDLLALKIGDIVLIGDDEWEFSDREFHLKRGDDKDSDYMNYIFARRTTKGTERRKLTDVEVIAVGLKIRRKLS